MVKPPEIRFNSPQEEQEKEQVQRLKREGGIFFSEKKDAETGEQSRRVNILGVELETYASNEDMEALKQGLILSPLDQSLLRGLAESTVLRQPILFEGDPGAGKTFLMRKLIQFIHGKDTPILELVGTPRTTELEILGHWAPKGLSEEETKEYRAFLERASQGGALKELREKTGAEFSRMGTQFSDGTLPADAFSEQFGAVTTTYINALRVEMVALTQQTSFSRPQSEWEFKQGFLLQVYAGKDGRGMPGIVDELNLIPSNYQQIFLQIGGEQGALSDSISFWGNSGKTSYHRGKDAMLYFATNFPEKTPGRSEVVAPLSDRVVWRVITPQESAAKKQAIIRTAGGRLVTRMKEVSTILPERAPLPMYEGIQWDGVLDGALGAQIADMVELFDTNFLTAYEQLGDSITMKGKERKRSQLMEFSGRNALRVFSYLDHFQVRDSTTGRVDISQTLRNAFQRYYLDRLASDTTRSKLNATLEDMLTAKSTGNALKVTFDNALMSRKEIFDLLVKRVSGPQGSGEQTKDEQERIFKQAGYDFDDERELLLNNPLISAEMREQMRKSLE